SSWARAGRDAERNAMATAASAPVIRLERHLPARHLEESSFIRHAHAAPMHQPDTQPRTTRKGCLATPLNRRHRPSRSRNGESKLAPPSRRKYGAAKGGRKVPETAAAPAGSVTDGPADAAEMSPGSALTGER